jgi:probable F420-dependent oxidoreductase
MPVSRKIRFGVAVSFPDTIQQWRDLARKVEDLGYDVLLVADHMTRQWSPLLALLAAAEATTRLHVGTQVMANDFRRPIVLAKEIATMDVMTEGRFEPGIGVGHPATSAIGVSDYKQLGIEMDEPGPRVTRLEESLHIIRSYLDSPEPFEYEGKYYATRETVNYPRPVTSPHPRIMVAGAGPRILKLAGRQADIINIAPRPPVKGMSARGTVGFGLDITGSRNIIKEAAGARYDDIELCVFADRAVITKDPGPAREKLASDLGITEQQMDEMPHTLIGEPDAICEAILKFRDSHDVSYRIVQGAHMDDFAPVVAKVGGK